jgi:hypothetical protein
MSDTSTQNRRTYLITHPRSASNLLRILNIGNQNLLQRKQGGYFFMPLMDVMLDTQSRLIPLSTWSPEIVSQTKGLYEQGFEKLQTHCKDSQVAGKMVFVKEHGVFLSFPYNVSECLFPTSTSRNIDSNSVPESATAQF